VRLNDVNFAHLLSRISCSLKAGPRVVLGALRHAAARAGYVKKFGTRPQFD
jgi:hypothetical protein